MLAKYGNLPASDVGDKSTKNALASTTPQSKPTVYLAVNCGNIPGDIIKGHVITWLPDQQYSAENKWGYLGDQPSTALRHKTPASPNPSMGKPGAVFTLDLGIQEACLTERYGDGPHFSYQFDLPNGKYTVKLGFNEAQVSAVGKRIFSIFIQNIGVEKDLDVFKVAGEKYVLLVRAYKSVSVVDGKLVIKFVHGPQGVPFVNFIEIIKE
jgi:hypothetical protein